MPAPDPGLDWLRSPEAARLAKAAKAKAISAFKKRFPNADMSRFKVQVDFDAKHKATGEVFFPENADAWADVLLIDRKNWTQAMKDALSLHQDSGFPIQLSINKGPPQRPIPAVVFSENAASVGDVLIKKQRIYVTPTEFFTVILLSSTSLALTPQLRSFLSVLRLLWVTTTSNSKQRKG